MKHTFSLLLFLSISALAFNCKTDSNDYDSEHFASNGSDTIIVNFEFGEALGSWKNIYVIWMEDTLSEFVQNISISQKLITGGTTGTALPYWKFNKYPISSDSEVDAVTSATKANTDFSVSAILKDSTIRKFVLYFEVDRSFEPNDWFSDQPALLYAAEVNLDDSSSEYELTPIGWTPNENDQNVIPNTPKGKLQTEIKYITHHKDGSSFGAADERSSTKMVKKITASIKSSVATKIEATLNDDFGVLFFPNPTNELVNIQSNKIIEEVIITNLMGQTILHTHPEKFQTTIDLSQIITPEGTYFATIKTSEGVSTHKILISE